MALLAAWRRCTEESHWQQQRRSWGARKMADVGDASMGETPGEWWFHSIDRGGGFNGDHRVTFIC